MAASSGSELSAKPTMSPRSFSAFAWTSCDPTRGDSRMTADGAQAILAAR